MRHPTFNEEKKLWKKGYRIIVGLDESGRGSLAGPVVAAAVILKLQATRDKKGVIGIRDSKKLSPKKREECYKFLTNNPQIEWGVGRVGSKVIDRINVLEATKLAMERAVRKLKTKNEKARIDFLVLDGKMKLDLSIPQKSVVKADKKVFSCAAASIIAKVVRDRTMKKLDNKYPRYGFDKHKGYGTKHHLKMLKKYGPSVIHRKSFKPVKNLLKLNKDN